MCCSWLAREPIHAERQMQARACAPTSQDPSEVNMQTQAPVERGYLAPEAMLFGGLSLRRGSYCENAVRFRV